MNKIEQMLKEMCPGGVKKVPLSEICSDIYSGATPSKAIKAYWEGGTIPWMSSGEVNLGQVYAVEGRITQLGYDKCSTKMVPENSVVIALAGQGKTRGTVAILRTSVCTNQSIAALVPNKNMITGDFLFHYLKGQYMKLRDISSGDGTRGGLNLQMIRKFEIPLPPLAIQQEIVKVLDSFTAYAAELQAELQARKEQYEYYRNQLLTHFEGDQPVKEYSLGELCSVVTDGSHSSPIGTENGYNMPSVKDMTSTGFDFSQCKKISKEDYDILVHNGCKPQINDVLIAKDGSMLKYAFPIEKETDYVILSSIAILRPKLELINPKYLAHYFKQEKIKESVVREYSSKGGVPRIVLKNFKKIPVIVPTLSEQSRIVSILDKFETLVNDLSEGLPAEIAAVQEQYEYYRNKLLTF